MSANLLNLDVLATACEFLTDVSDTLSFSLTCSTLRPAANRSLLSMKPVYLADGVSVRRFHKFLFADAPARAQHVRALDILNPPRNRPLQPTLPGDSSLLCDILTSCPHLEHISICLENDSSRFTDDQSVIDAIRGIQSLRSLSIHGSSTNAFVVLRQVCAPLRELDVGFWNADIGFWSPLVLDMFVPGHLAPILEKLKLCNFLTDSYEIDIPTDPVSLSSLEPYLNATTYPLVRSLHIGFVLHRPLLSHLQYFFPALDGTLSLGRLDSRIPKGTYTSLRAVNESAQEGDEGRLPTWKKLDRLVCDPRMFFVLGLRCPIRLVMLDHCSVHTRLYSGLALHKNPVPRLKMSFRLSDSEKRNVLSWTFSPELAHVLTHLTLVLEYSNDGVPRQTNGNAPADPENNNIVSELPPLRNLTHLRLVVHANIYEDEDSPIAYSEEFVRATRGESVSDRDVAGTAALLARPLPALQYIFMSTSGRFARIAERDRHRSNGTDYYASDRRFWKAYERWRVARAWRVDDSDGGVASGGAGSVQGQRRLPVLVELHEDVAETIMRHEELVLSEADEALLHLKGD